MENLCQRVSVTLGHRSSNGQSYAILSEFEYLSDLLFMTSFMNSIHATFSNSSAELILGLD